MEKQDKLGVLKAKVDLIDFRKKHTKRLMEQNCKVLEEILLNEGTKDRDKIEAAKALARMVSGLQAERPTAQKGIKEGTGKLRKLSPEEISDIEARITPPEESQKTPS